ncbi:hypothetical protein, partial [Salmonella sp. s55962]|uniref:hypothetical protein n=1 Tax=Salmonella sp. s55962 TaxID=3159685 RepID=UPI00398057F0
RCHTRDLKDERSVRLTFILHVLRRIRLGNSIENVEDHETDNFQFECTGGQQAACAKKLFKEYAEAATSRRRKSWGVTTT